MTSCLKSVVVFVRVLEGGVMGGALVVPALHRYGKTVLESHHHVIIRIGISNLESMMLSAH